MTTQSTIDKLIEMRLTSMSDAFRTQLEDPKMKEIPFEDPLRDAGGHRIQQPQEQQPETPDTGRRV